MNLSAVILAGGESRRMGRDKAWVEVGGQPLILRALCAIRDSGIKEVFISGRAGTDYSALGYPVLFDREPGCGPLAGIERAFEATEAPLLLVLAVDLPWMSATFLRKLAERCDPLTGAIPKLRGQLEPLVAIYPKRCQLLARDCLREGCRAARDFADACLREHAVKPFVVARADSGCFDNWNTPQDIPG
jgi:molybdenum cofactor guanylyltransferase